VSALPAGPDAVGRALARAAELQPAIGAFAEIGASPPAPDAAADGALGGVPIAVKDVIDVARMPTRLGTAGAGHRVASEDAAVVAQLRAAGAVVIGKTTTHELAIGMITPGARNPHDTGRITGGSSGGSAAAVAAGIVPIALGTDTNGSIRSPAAHCGVIGFKPTRGLLPTAGVAPLAPTQDTVGVMASGMDTLMAAWRALRPPDDERATGSGRAVSVGFARGATAAASEPVAAAVVESVRRLADAGIEIVDVELPDLEIVRAASILVILREAAHAWRAVVDEQGAGLSPEVRAALRAARTVSEQAYRDAKRVRLDVCRRLAALPDALLMPTVPVTATPAGLERVELRGRMRAVEALQSHYTALASLTGQPAISLPGGTDEQGLPIGIQLVGRAGADDELLQLAVHADRAFV
jgi:aspartyl-tRNA(Asn)/glutamyl-tRNA(Gln) amidotransferase subunit A